MSAALPDDSINRRKAQSRAFAEFLGGKKRFENAALRLRVHSCSSIGHRQENVCARFLWRMATRIIFVNINVVSFNCEFPAMRQCVTGVYRQIDDHLFDLALIGLD